MTYEHARLSWREISAFWCLFPCAVLFPRIVSSVRKKARTKWRSGEAAKQSVTSPYHHPCSPHRCRLRMRTQSVTRPGNTSGCASYGGTSCTSLLSKTPRSPSSLRVSSMRVSGSLFARCQFARGHGFRKPTKAVRGRSRKMAMQPGSISDKNASL